MRGARTPASRGSAPRSERQGAHEAACQPRLREGRLDQREADQRILERVDRRLVRQAVEQALVDLDDVLREVGEGVVGAAANAAGSVISRAIAARGQREHEEPLRARDEAAGAAEPATHGEGVGGRVRHGGRV